MFIPTYFNNTCNLQQMFFLGGNYTHNLQRNYQLSYEADAKEFDDLRSTLVHTVRPMVLLG